MGKADHVLKSSGLRGIRDIMKKWQEQELGVALSRWGNKWAKEKLRKERFVGGLRDTRAILDKWRKGVYKSMLENWRAKRKVMLTKAKEKEKRDAVKKMVEESTNEVKAKVTEMIKASEEENKKKVKKAK